MSSRKSSSSSLLRRMRILKALLNLRLGPGAAVFPTSPQVTQPITHIHLTFRYPEGVRTSSYARDHSSLRKFWHHYLPRLKYHNPSVPMTVERVTEPGPPATLFLRYGRHLGDQWSREEFEKGPKARSSDEGDETNQKEEKEEKKTAIALAGQEGESSIKPSAVTSPPSTPPLPSESLSEQARKEKLESSNNRPVPRIHSPVPLPDFTSQPEQLPEISPSTLKDLQSHVSSSDPTTLPIDVSRSSPDHILSLVMAATGATPVKMTDEEKTEISTLQAQKEKSQRDRAHVAELVKARKMEAATLRVAKGEPLSKRAQQLLSQG